MTTNVQLIPLKSLKESPTNPRKTFANQEKLVASMVAQGQIVPLLVRPLPGDKFEVVAGHRRLRAAKEAKIDQLLCDVRSLDDAQVIEIQITENLQREGLSELEEAETFEAMQEHGKMTAEQIAKRIGVSLGTVYSRLKLLALCPEARKAVAEGVLPGSVAVPLARIPTHALQAKAIKTLKERFMYPAESGEQRDVISARDSIAFLQRDFCRALRGAPFDLKDDMLTEGSGSCLKCPKNSKQGTPGLFEDLAGQKGTAFCTDVACFNAKVTASWAAVAKAAEARGAKVLSADDGAKIFQYGHLAHDSKWLELDTPNHADSKRRPWREFYDRLPAEQRPQLVVAPDKEFKPRELVDSEKLRAALADAPGAPKWAKEEQKQAEKMAKARAETRERNAESALQKRVILAGLQKVAAGLTSVTEDLLRFVLAGLADRWVPQDVLNALEVEDRDEYEKKVAKGDVKWLRTALLMWGAYSGDVVTPDGEEGYPAAFKALARAAEVDVKAIEKAIVAGDEAEALMKGKKGGKS